MRRLLLCAIGALALVACGDDQVQSPAANAPVATSAASEASTTQSVPEALAFAAPRVGGGTVDLAQYAGTPVLLWFWAPT